MFSTTDLGAALRDLRYSLARDSSARARSSSRVVVDCGLGPSTGTKRNERSASFDLFHDGSQLVLGVGTPTWEWGLILKAEKTDQREEEDDLPTIEDRQRPRRFLLFATRT